MLFLDYFNYFRKVADGFLTNNVNCLIFSQKISPHKTKKAPVGCFSLLLCLQLSRCQALSSTVRIRSVLSTILCRRCKQW